MPFCPNCGIQQPENARFCEACGAPMLVAVVNEPLHSPTLSMQAPDGSLVCPSCGAQLEADSLFCDMCGVRLGGVDPAVTPPAHPPTMVDLPAGPPTVAVTPTPSRPANIGITAPAELPASVALSTSQARLVIQATQEVLHLPYGKAEVIIGRDDPIGNLFPDIDLTDCGGDRAGVSRQHARIFFQGAQAFVEDRNSTNHTYVNDQELVPWQPHLVKSGDEIKFGRLATTFYL